MRRTITIDEQDLTEAAAKLGAKLTEWGEQDAYTHEELRGILACYLDTMISNVIAAPQDYIWESNPHIPADWDEAKKYYQHEARKAQKAGG